jgi:hypothetical protein
VCSDRAPSPCSGYPLLGPANVYKSLDRDVVARPILTEQLIELTPAAGFATVSIADLLLTRAESESARAGCNCFCERDSVFEWDHGSPPFSVLGFLCS